MNHIAGTGLAVLMTCIGLNSADIQSVGSTYARPRRRACDDAVGLGGLKWPLCGKFRGDGRRQHRLEQAFGRRPLGEPLQNVFEPSIEQ